MIVKGLQISSGPRMTIWALIGGRLIRGPVNSGKRFPGYPRSWNKGQTMSNEEKHIMRVVLKAPKQLLFKLVKELRLDIGGAGPRPLPDGTFSLEAYATEDVLDHLKDAGGTFEVIEDATKVGRERQKEVGRGDRFEGGQIVPRGLGKKE